MDLKRKRIRVLVDTWSEIMLRGVKSREEAVEILKKVYQEHGIDPIRGASTPPDLFDKDMISLYIIGKYGLGLDAELPREVLETLFPLEVAIERFVDKLLKSSDPREVCEEEKEFCSSLDDSRVARVLRFAFTKMYFGFSTEEEFRRVLKALYEMLPQFAETIRRFTKFYIAYKVGELIAKGQVRNRMEMSLAKNTIALELSIPKAVPSNRYIVEVARHYFQIPDKIREEVGGREQ